MVTGSLAPQNPYIVTVDDSDPDIVWQGVWGTSGTPPEYNRYQLSHRAVDEIHTKFGLTALHTLPIMTAHQ